MIVCALASGAYAAAVSDVLANITLFPDNGAAAPGPKVFDGPPGGPRVALDRTNRLGWVLSKGKEHELTYTQGTVANAVANATAIGATEGYPLEGPHAETDAHTDAGPPGPSLGFAYAGVSDMTINFGNFTGSGSPAPAGITLWTDWTLTIDWAVVLAAPNPATDWAFGGVTVNVNGAGVNYSFMKAFNTDIDGPVVNEPAGGVDVVVPMSFAVPKNSMSQVDVSVGILSIAEFEEVPPVPLGDYGDALDSYQTLLASDGPRYRVGDVRLGAEWDREPDGQPSVGAILDDMTGVPDDEDGVLFDAAGFDVTLSNLTLVSQPMHLDAWVDLNRNGVFDHKAEQIIDMVTLVLPGTDVEGWTWDELGLTWADVHDTYSRFRVTLIDDPNDEWAGGVDNFTDVTPWGEFTAAEDLIYDEGISHGEVEDYYIPEPTSMVLLAAGAVGLIRRRRS